MEKADIANEVTEREEERKQLEDIEACLSTLQRLQSLFLARPHNGNFLKAEELEQAKGRKCILGISGLKYLKYEKFFEVTPIGVNIVEPYADFNTYIAAPVDSVLRVLQGVLNGDTSAFTAEWARGKTRIVGARHLHDGYVFGEVFRRLAELIKRYRTS